MTLLSFTIKNGLGIIALLYGKMLLQSHPERALEAGAIYLVGKFYSQNWM
jgi:hypothetical protein